MRKHTKGLIGILILSAAVLDGCRSGSSISAGACDNPSTCYLTSVAYGAGLFVAVGTGGNFNAAVQGGGPWIEVSTDGINWKHVDIPYNGVQTYPEPILQSIVYGKDGFVTTDGVHVLHSTDGLNWSIESFQDTSDQISYVIYDGTRYILYSNPNGRYGDGALSNSNFPWKVSSDGVNWTDYGKITVTNGPAGEPVSIIQVAGTYAAAWQSAPSITASTTNLTATSTDGLSWTLGTPATVTYTIGIAAGPAMYDILYTGGQYLLFGGTDAYISGEGSWGVALHGSSMSAMTIVGPLNAPQGEFNAAGEALHGNPYENHGLVSNGTVTVGLGEGGLFVTTDGITWHYESLEGVVPKTGCASSYPGTPTCTAFASGAAAPGGSIVVLIASGSGYVVAGAESTDGIHWVKSNL